MEDLSPLARQRLAYKPALARCLAGDELHFTFKDELVAEDVAADEPPPTFAEHARRASDDVGDRGGRLIRLADPLVFPNTAQTPTFRVTEASAAPSPDLRSKPVRGPGPGGAARLGLLFSGGPAAGGHNVAAGMFDCLARRFSRANGEPALVGFLGGAEGLVRKRWTEVTAETLKPLLNQGGFHLLGTGRFRLHTPEHFAAAARTCRDLKLDGLVIVGGDDSATNAAYLAEHFAADAVKTAVVAVPKTVDNDFQTPESVKACFGFDSASKTYAEIVGNLAADARSARKYWHFVRIMGRRAGHLTLEVALRARPNLALLGEEVAEKKLALADIVTSLTELVRARRERGLNYGVVLVPEGLLSFTPEIQSLAEELAGGKPFAELSAAAAEAARSVPSEILQELTLATDAHGNPDLSALETEKLLARLVADRLPRDAKAAFRPRTHFCGYEGRAGLPSDFDATYAYNLGHAACLLAAGGANGAVVAVENPADAAEAWRVAGVPLSRTLRAERREGKDRLVVRKTLVDLKGPAFAAFAEQRDAWRLEDHYACPGPMVFDATGGTLDPPLTTRLAAEAAGKREKEARDAAATGAAAA
jgi:pyrophosphate--fructose-6-phosphate 1-phosphotransferase